MARSRWSARDVFCNFPFDTPYERLYLALISAVSCTGQMPRTVLEIPPQRDRLARLQDLIAGCAWSIHDLSRVGLSTSGRFRVPRFNMPFELGLAIGLAARHPDRYQFRLLEAEPHRLVHSLSDLNGYDPSIHHGTVDGMFHAICDVFADSPHFRITGVQRFRQVYRALRIFQRQQFGDDSPYTPTRFRKLVTAAQAYVGVFSA